MGLTEYQGKFAAVEIAPFWSEELTAIDRKRGKAFAEANLKMLESE